jgi:hypothetical protein
MWVVVTVVAVGLAFIVQSWVPLLLIPLAVAAASVNRELWGGHRRRNRRWAEAEILRLLLPPFEPPANQWEGIHRLVTRERLRRELRDRCQPAGTMNSEKPP